MATVMTTFLKNLRGRQLYPFAIGFVTVLVTSGALFRLKEEDYVDSNNSRFAAPFLKDKGDGHGHGH